MFQNFKKTICFIIALLLCFSLCACKQEEPVTTKPTATNTEEEKKPATPPSSENNLIVDEEILHKTNAWLGRGDSGKLLENDSYKITEIKSKNDLAPFRQYMYNLTDKDIDTFLADEGGKCILVELTGKDEHTLYGTSSILETGSTISIFVSIDEESEESLPMHTYFLLHFPSEIYDGQNFAIVF